MLILLFQQVKVGCVYRRFGGTNTAFYCHSLYFEFVVSYIGSVVLPETLKALKLSPCLCLIPLQTVEIYKTILI